MYPSDQWLDNRDSASIAEDQKKKTAKKIAL